MYALWYWKYILLAVVVSLVVETAVFATPDAREVDIFMVVCIGKANRRYIARVEKLLFPAESTRFHILVHRILF